MPRVFRCDFPQELAVEALKCKTDDDARQLGIEWSTEQCRQLYKAGVNNIHFYTVSAVDSVREVARRLLCIRDSLIGVTDNSKFKTQNSKLPTATIQNSKFKIQNSQ